MRFVRGASSVWLVATETSSRSGPLGEDELAAARPSSESKNETPIAATEAYPRFLRVIEGVMQGADATGVPETYATIDAHFA